MKKNILLYYVGTKGINFGDSINPILFERIFGISVKRGYPTNSDVTGIGSILNMLTLKDIIKYKKLLYLFKYNNKPIISMGSGFGSFIDKNNFLNSTYKDVIPFVLRGRLSHGVLENINNKKYPNVAYGDLGLLFSYLLEKSVNKEYELGITAHNYDLKHYDLTSLKNLSKKSLIINLKQPPLETLEQIAKCETVISSSLHGLIAADSLHIPNKRFKLSNHGKDYNIDFKFDDYYSIFSNTDFHEKSVKNYIDLTGNDINDEKLSGLLPEKIIQDYKISKQETETYKETLLKKGSELKDMI